MQLKQTALGLGGGGCGGRGFGFLLFRLFGLFGLSSGRTLLLAGSQSLHLQRAENLPARVECSSSDFSLLFQGSDFLGILPSNLLCKNSQRAVLAARLETQLSECGRDNHSLHLVVWRRDSVYNLQSSKSLSTSWSLVGQHSSDCSPEHLRW